MVFHNRKIRNKERVGNRGPKKRYSVFRAELNRKWEQIFERLVRQLCQDNDLTVEDHMVADERIPWEHTWRSLYRTAGYKLKSRSIRAIQTEVEFTQPPDPSSVPNPSQAGLLDSFPKQH